VNSKRTRVDATPTSKARRTPLRIVVGQHRDRQRRFTEALQDPRPVREHARLERPIPRSLDLDVDQQHRRRAVDATHAHELVHEAPTGDRVGAQRRQLFVERLDPGLPIDQRVDFRRDERHQWTDVQIERCLPETIEVDRTFVRFHAGANAHVENCRVTA
jgi:hypothetical protein